MSIKTSNMFEVRPVAQREWNILILLALVGAVYFKYVVLRSGFYEKPI